MNGRDLRLNDLHTLTRMKYINPNQSQLESVLNQPNDNLSNLAKYNNLLRKQNISSVNGSNKPHSSPCPSTFASEDIAEKRKIKKRKVEVVKKEELSEGEKIDISIIKKESDSSIKWESLS